MSTGNPVPDTLRPAGILAGLWQTNPVSDAERKGMEKGMAKGIEKGIAQGMEKGIAQGQSNERKETARRMKNDGIPPETIAKYTQLSIEEIEKLW